jgi:hypothetical protein
MNRKIFLIMVILLSVISVFATHEEGALIFSTSDPILLLQTYTDSIVTDASWLNDLSKVYMINEFYNIYEINTIEEQRY